MNDTDPLLVMLKRSPESPLPDDGFSQRVLDALPRTHSPPHRLRRWTFGAGAVVGGIATTVLAPPIEGAFGLEIWLAPMLRPVLTVGFMSLLAACAAWAFIAVDFRETKSQ